MASMLRGGVATARGDRQAAIAAFERAGKANRVAELGTPGQAAKRRLGELLRGERGRTLIDEANRWMIEGGMTDPDVATALFAPIPWDEKLLGP